MSSVGFIVIVILSQSPMIEPGELVSKLGSARFSQREAASAELERLGKPALKALRSAKDGKDPEIRNRASLILSRIEASILTQPSAVNLNFKDATIQEVFRAVGDQAGIKLVLRPENSPAFRNRRLSMVHPESVTFWKAIDEIADKGGLQFNYGPHGSMAGREPEFPLFDGGARPILPSYDHGPFRVILNGLHFQRDVTFTGGHPVGANPPAPNAEVAFPAMIQENCHAQIQVVGEPRFSIGQAGPVRISRALDDKGQSLVFQSDAQGSQTADLLQRSERYFGFASGSFLQIQVPLARPASPGSMIKTLKGNVTVALATRKPDPLIASLKNAAGRTFQNDEVVLMVHEFRKNPEPRQTTIELSIRHVKQANLPTSPADPSEMPVYNRPDQFQQQIDVLDGFGRPIMWYPSRFDGENNRITLTMAAPDASTTPVELRFYDIARATTDVEFEFHDVPLP